jgi:hypothetical protein
VFLLAVEPTTAQINTQTCIASLPADAEHSEQRKLRVICTLLPAEQVILPPAPALPVLQLPSMPELPAVVAPDHSFDPADFQEAYSSPPRPHRNISISSSHHSGPHAEGPGHAAPTGRTGLRRGASQEREHGVEAASEHDQSEETRKRRRITLTIPTSSLARAEQATTTPTPATQSTLDEEPDAGPGADGWKVGTRVIPKDQKRTIHPWVIRVADVSGAMGCY